MKDNFLYFHIRHLRQTMQRHIGRGGQTSQRAGGPLYKPPARPLDPWNSPRPRVSNIVAYCCSFEIPPDRGNKDPYAYMTGSHRAPPQGPGPLDIKTSCFLGIMLFFNSFLHIGKDGWIVRQWAMLVVNCQCSDGSQGLVSGKAWYRCTFHVFLTPWQISSTMRLIALRRRGGSGRRRLFSRSHGGSSRSASNPRGHRPQRSQTQTAEA